VDYSFAVLASPVWTWLHRLGGPGLLLIGIIDASAVPMPGSVDAFLVVLAARRPAWWPYYAFMATIGAVVGGYITYALGRKGGKEAIQHKLRKDKAEKVFKRFDRWGFETVAVGALLPPPFPLVPVLLAAGALQYSRKKFLAALTLGRSIRYCLIAGLGSLYAGPITSFFSRYYKPTALVLAGIAVIGSLFAIREYMHSRKPKSKAPDALHPSKAA